MSKLCPKCDLGSDDKAAFCRWCGGDLRAVEGGDCPPAGAVPPTGPCPLPPPSPGPPLPAPLGSGFPPPPSLSPNIPNHLVWAVLSTILCCLPLGIPLGIVSIVYAAQVNTHVFRGDIPRAHRSSRLARNWAIATVAVSVVVWIICGIAVVVCGRGALGWMHF